MAVKQEPPHCNTGVLSTNHNSMKARVDWISCTFFDEVKFANEIIQILGLCEHEFELKNGILGYNYMLDNGYIKILYEAVEVEAEQGGLHLIISGKGCRYLENHSRELDVIVARLIDYNVKFTRFDVCVDDYSIMLSQDFLLKKAMNGEISSSMKYYSCRFDGFIVDGKKKGITIYFGSASSKAKITIYDKKEELQSKGEKVEHEIIRYEVSLKKERADITARLFLQMKTGRLVKSLLHKYIEVKNKGKDENKSRWNTNRDWLKFLGQVDNLILTTGQAPRDIEKIENWLNKQVSRNLAVMFSYHEGDLEKLMQLIQEGQHKFTNEDMRIISG